MPGSPIVPGPPIVAGPAVQPAPPAIGQPAPTTAGGWNTQVRRARALAQDFKASTGDRIFFADGEATIGSRARAVVEQQAQWLKRFPQVVLTLAAHADDRGGREFNEDLSIRRGEAVKARLVQEGIDPARIKVVPYGRERPIASCEDSGCSSQNRRVVTTIGEAAPSERQGQGPLDPRDAPRASFMTPQR